MASEGTTAVRLTYFDMRGRAEAIRLLLHATQTDFDDRRVVDKDDWEGLKPTLPFERLPVYEDSGRLLCECHAILRYLGRGGPPVARDDLHRAELDAVADALAELREDLWRFNWRENYYEHLETYARDVLLPRLRQLEAWLARTSESDEWFGVAFSHVDCLAYCYLDEIDAFFPVVLARFPRLAELHARVASLPGISDYLASAARPPVFGMGIAGPKVDPRVTLAPDRPFANPWTPPLDLAPFERNQRRLTEIEG